MARLRLDELLESVDDSELPALSEVVRAIALTYDSRTVMDVLGGEDSWEEVFTAIREAKAALDAVEHDAVRLARLDGQSWADIGEDLGLSRAGAQRRHGRTDLAELDELDELREAEMAALLAETKLAVRRATADGNGERLAEIAQSYLEHSLELGREYTSQRLEIVKKLEFRY